MHHTFWSLSSQLSMASLEDHVIMWLWYEFNKLDELSNDNWMAGPNGWIQCSQLLDKHISREMGSFFFKRTGRSTKLERRKAPHAAPKQKENRTTPRYGPCSFAAWTSWCDGRQLFFELLQITSLIGLWWRHWYFLWSVNLRPFYKKDSAQSSCVFEWETMTLFGSKC